MRTILKATLLVGIVALAGCGGSDEVVTDPSQLEPLTEEQKAEIKALDAQIEDEEQQGGVVPPG